MQFNMDSLFYLTLIFLQMFVFKTFCDIQTRMQDTFKRPDLNCPDACNRKDSIVSRMRCCICLSFSVIQPGHLSTEFILKDNMKRLQIKKPTENLEYYKLIHRNETLTEFPINICDFNSSLFYVDFSYNRIRTFPNIDCLFQLDTLLLRGNLIETVDSKVINQLKFLRILDLSYNSIKWISPGMTIDFNGNLFNVSMRFNNLKEVDITNLIMTKQLFFCKFDYSNNYIEKIENRENWVCSKNISLGNAGIVNLSSNSMTEFFDEKYISYLGFTLGLFHKLALYKLDIRQNKWACDCKMFFFIQKGMLFFILNYKKLKDYYWKCYSPQNPKGTAVIDIIKTNRLDLFICTLSLKDRCPPKCYCFYQPSVNNRTVVDCSNRNMSKLPSELPHYSNLEVDLSGNRLINIPTNMDYYKRIKHLNVSQNNIGNISQSALFKLKDATIDLRGNNLNHVSRAFLMLGRCNVLLESVIDCKCSDAWMINWLQNGTASCTDHVKVYCMRNKRRIQHVNRGELGCKTTPDKSIHQLVVWLFVSVVTLTVSAFISVKFRYELFILCRSATHFIRPQNKLLPFDFYIVCNDQDCFIRSYMVNTLLPFCYENGYRPFLPCVHGDVGQSREEEIIEVMSMCKAYVIFLSLDYDGVVKWKEKEWKYAWHNFANDRSRKLIIVNYDMVTTKDNFPKYMKAFLNLGLDIDFANRQKLLEKQIISSIPLPVPLVQNDSDSE